MTIKKVDFYYKDADVAEKYIERRFSNLRGRHIHSKQVDFINKAIKNYAVKRLLDVACGPARVGAELKELERAYGIDSSREMLRIARKEANKKWEFLRKDAFRLNFRPKSFDMIISLRFVRHYKKPKRKLLYKQFKKLLIDNGLLILDAANRENKRQIVERRKGEEIVYDKLYEKEELIRELERNGFKVLRMENVFNRIFISTAISKVFPSLKLISLGKILIDIVEKVPSRSPFEWLVLCQKCKIK